MSENLNIYTLESLFSTELKKSVIPSQWYIYFMLSPHQGWSKTKSSWQLNM